jgi:hypothetical protein
MSQRSLRNVLFGGAVAAAALIGAAPAFAGVIVDFGFVPLGGTISYTPDGAIGSSNEVSGLGSITAYSVNNVHADDTTGVALSAPVSLNWNDPISFVQGLQSIATVTESFTTAAGTYDATFNELFAQSTPGSTSLAWVLEGTLTLPDATTQPVFLSASFTNVGNSNGTSTNVSFTETSNPPPIITTPEPVSMAVLGVGLLGLGVVRRRTR